MDEQHIQNEVILGIDTHLNTYVGVMIDYRGKWLATLSLVAMSPSNC